MAICIECGVELDDEMTSCPLCNTSVSSRVGPTFNKETEKKQLRHLEEKMYLMQWVLWQVTVVLLLSGVVATFVINLSIAGSITWAIYPISICLMILAYASLIALWRTKFIFQLLGGWFISALLLLAFSWYGQQKWPIFLALPIVSVVNVVGVVFYLLLDHLKTKGLNVLAMVFVLLAVVGLAIETIISLYFTGEIILRWSIIVAACLLPVTAAILFMYFRTRNNSDLQKIFHT